MPATFFYGSDSNTRFSLRKYLRDESGLRDVIFSVTTAQLDPGPSLAGRPSHVNVFPTASSLWPAASDFVRIEVVTSVESGGSLTMFECAITAYVSTADLFTPVRWTLDSFATITVCPDKLSSAMWSIVSRCGPAVRR